MTEPRPGYYQADAWFYGNGYSTSTNYAVCVNGPTNWCGGLYEVVDSSGNIAFSIGAVHPGTYTVQVFSQTQKGLVPVSSIITITLISP